MSDLIGTVEVRIGTDPSEWSEIDPDLIAPLRTVIDPCSAATGVPLNLLDMGLIGRARRVVDEVDIDLQLTSPICWNAAPMMEAIELAIKAAHPDITSVRIHADHGLTWTPDRITPGARQLLQARRPVSARGPQPLTSSKGHAK